MTLDHVGEIAHSHADGMYKHARLIVGSNELAEDVVQDVFTSTIREINKGRKIEHEKLRAWLHTCVQNSALYALRKIKRRPVEQLKSDDMLVGNEEIEDKFVNHSESKAILALLPEMPLRQREAFISIDLKGLNYSQTAVEMGTTEDSVRQLIFRARSQIRSRLSNSRTNSVFPLFYLASFALQLRRPLSRAHEILSQIISRISLIPSWFFCRLIELTAVVGAPFVAALFIASPVIGTDVVIESNTPGANLGVSKGATSSNRGAWRNKEDVRLLQLETKSENESDATVTPQPALGMQPHIDGSDNLLSIAGSGFNQLCFLVICNSCNTSTCLFTQQKNKDGGKLSVPPNSKQFSVVTNQKRSVVVDSDVSVVISPRQKQVVYQSHKRRPEQDPIIKAINASKKSRGHKGSGVEDGVARYRGKIYQQVGTLSLSGETRTHLEAPVREPTDRKMTEPDHSLAAKQTVPVARSIDRGVNVAPTVPNQPQQATGERQNNIERR